MATNQRINNEIKNINKFVSDNETSMFILDDPTDLYNLSGSIYGPVDTPYHGYMFNISIKIPKEYPFKSPDIKFTTPILHPNIDMSGRICLDTLQDKWTPANTICATLISINSLLSDPNPSSPLNAEIAKKFTNNKADYKKTIKDHCKKNAIKVE
jgi:ubiquitin-protein ligase